MYKKVNPEWIKHADFELLDLIMLELAYFVSFLIRHAGFSRIFDGLYLQYAICLAISHVLVVLIFHNYKSILQRGKWVELRSVIKHVAIVVLLTILFIYLMHDSGSFSRIIFVLNALFGVVLCYLERLFWKNVVRTRVRENVNKNAMMLICTYDRLDEMVKQLTKKRYRGYQITSVYLLDGKKHRDTNREFRRPVFFGREEMLDFLCHNVVDEVYIDTRGTTEDLNELAEIIMDSGTVVHLGIGSLADALPNAQITKFHDLLAISGTMAAANAWELLLKRVIDVVGGIAGVAITGILYLFIAPAIKRADPGPAFFRQERVGKGGRIFKIVKFRSMYQDAEERKKELMAQNEMQGLMFKMDNDPRIIGSEKGPGKGIGNFIRRTSLDEFPQFWNVLKGEMSLVGTRPPTVEEFKQYKIYHKARLAMRPGITGLWQVSGRSNITDFDEIVALDTEYIKNWNLGLDIKILFKTVKVLFTGDGAK